MYSIVFCEREYSSVLAFWVVQDVSILVPLRGSVTLYLPFIHSSCLWKSAKDVANVWPFKSSLDVIQLTLLCCPFGHRHFTQLSHTLCVSPVLVSNGCKLTTLLSIAERLLQELVFSFWNRVKKWIMFNWLTTHRWSLLLWRSKLTAFNSFIHRIKLHHMRA